MKTEMAGDIGFEIDFLAVGEGERSGDAIAIRYGSAAAGYQVGIIDGGTKDSGEQLVEHVRRYYGTKTVDWVLNTHPDGDHSSGLTVIVERLAVRRLWMHRPWDHAEEILHLFHDGRITDDSLEARIRDALNAAHDLEQTAIARRVPIDEPFEGQQIGPFYVMSPSRDWYQTLIPQFRGTPEPVEAFQRVLAKALEAVKKASAAAVEWVGETMNIETLREGGETSAENESSVVLYSPNLGGKRIFLTGDAGIQALERAADFAARCGTALDSLDLVQIPHHGSRRNVSPSLLGRVMGKTAYISAAKDDAEHPRRVVTNAFKRRGARVYATKGNGLRHHFNIGDRDGWGPAQELPFYDRVEAY